MGDGRSCMSNMPTITAMWTGRYTSDGLLPARIKADAGSV